jgi:hypothetical protein
MKNNISFNMHQLTLSLLVSLVATANTAHAEDPTPIPDYTFLDAIKTGANLSSFRLRSESVNQDGNGPAGTSAANTPLKNAEGITLRSLIGWQTASFHDLSFAVQAINVAKITDDYNDGTGKPISSVSNQSNKVQYAKIIDPNYTNFNQLFVDWTGIKDNKIRAGRQQISLDNSRFIGDISFRDIIQVFDGVSLINKNIPDTDVYLGDFERVQQVTSELRSDGRLDIINAKYRISSTESLVGYGYFSSFEDLGFGRSWFGNAAGTTGGIANGNANALANQSNKIIGASLNGAHKLVDDWKVLYTAEYAKQTDFSSGDSRIDAHYYKIGGGAAYGAFSLRLDQELLSSNNGEYGFQTPFGTNHLFQGGGDRFLTTPREGIQDSYITAKYKYGDFSFSGEYHILNSDTYFNKVGGGMGDRFGKDWTASVAYTINKNLTTKIEYANFIEGDHYALIPTTTNNAGRFYDTEKIWLTALYSF